MSHRGNRPHGLRGSLLELASGAVEGLKRQRDAARNADSFDDAPEHTPQQGDFLHDFARIQLQYLNQLAHLGSNYSILATRALERVYDYWQPLGEAAPPELQRIEGHTDKRVTVHAHVENDTDDEAFYTVTCLELKVDSERPALFEELTPRFQHPKRSRRQRIQFSLDTDEQEEVRLGLRITDDLVVGAEYHGALIVTRKKSEHCDKSIVRYPFVLIRRANG